MRQMPPKRTCEILADPEFKELVSARAMAGIRNPSQTLTLSDSYAFGLLTASRAAAPRWKRPTR